MSRRGKSTDCLICQWSAVKDGAVPLVTADLKILKLGPECGLWQDRMHKTDRSYSVTVNSFDLLEVTKVDGFSETMIKEDIKMQFISGSVCRQYILSLFYDRKTSIL